MHCQCRNECGAFWAAWSGALHELVSEYLAREESFALPSIQRALMSLILRKLLAFSPHAIGITLGRMADSPPTH